MGEYAEFLIKEYTNGKLLPASKKSYDVEGRDGKLHQVKSRKITTSLSTQLGIIRSWDFHYLTIVLFDENGGVLKSLQCKKSVGKKYAKNNNYQKGSVITTTKEFLNDPEHTDITEEIKKINNGVF